MLLTGSPSSFSAIKSQFNFSGWYCSARMPRFSANCTSVARSPITKERSGSNKFFWMYFFSNLVFGLRQAQLSSGLCGQISTSSNSMPCDLNSAIMALCGLSKSSCGKESVPSPSWLDTITKRYLSLSLSKAGITFGSNFSFSRLSI